MAILQNLSNIINGIVGDDVMSALSTVLTTGVDKYALEGAQTGFKINQKAAGVLNQAIGIASQKGSGIDEATIKLMREAATGKGLAASQFVDDTANASTIAKIKGIADKNGADNAFSKILKDYTENYQGKINSPTEVLGKNGKISAGDRIGGFFHDPTLTAGGETYGSLRTKAVLGGYAVGAVGTRFLSGGDISHNSRGENDIAGIPFF